MSQSHSHSLQHVSKALLATHSFRCISPLQQKWDAIHPFCLRKTQGPGLSPSYRRALATNTQVPNDMLLLPWRSRLPATTSHGGHSTYNTPSFPTQHCQSEVTLLAPLYGLWPYNQHACDNRFPFPSSSSRHASSVYNRKLNY